MGCFCREAVQAMREDEPEQPDREEDDPDTEPADDRIAPVYGWLAARWLPAPRFIPREEWQDQPLPPDPPMPPEALGTIVSLVQAQLDCTDVLEFDATDPDQAKKLTRIVGTLNRRMDEFAWIEQDETPWQDLAQRAEQAEKLRAAAVAGLFQSPEDDEEEPFGPWRKRFQKVRAVVPLVAIAQMLEFDLAEPETPTRLAETLRRARAVQLPPLENPLRVLQVIARTQAVAQLRDIFRADPRQVPWTRLEQAVRRREEAAAELLPREMKLVDGRLVGMPPREPNPSMILNDATLERAARITPELVERLRWEVPPREEFDLLTTAAPLAALAKLMRVMGRDPVRDTPCGRECDAARTTRDARVSRDSGTGAARAA